MTELGSGVFCFLCHTIISYLHSFLSLVCVNGKLVYLFPQEARLWQIQQQLTDSDRQYGFMCGRDGRLYCLGSTGYLPQASGQAFKEDSTGNVMHIQSMSGMRERSGDCWGVWSWAQTILLTSLLEQPGAREVRLWCWHSFCLRWQLWVLPWVILLRSPWVILLRSSCHGWLYQC